MTEQTDPVILTVDELNAAYEVLMDKLVRIWSSIPDGKNPNIEEERRIIEVENQLDKFIQEMVKRGLYRKDWGGNEQ